MQLTRRESFAALAGLAAASFVTPGALAAGEAAAPGGPHVAPGQHAPVPLPFEPSARSGMILAPGATPVMPSALSRCAAIVPATCVP